MGRHTCVGSLGLHQFGFVRSRYCENVFKVYNKDQMEKFYLKNNLYKILFLLAVGISTKAFRVELTYQLDSV